MLKAVKSYQRYFFFAFSVRRSVQASFKERHPCDLITANGVITYDTKQ